MKFSALLLAAAAATALAPAAMAQTTSNTTSTVTTSTTTKGGRSMSMTTTGSAANAPNAAPEQMQPGAGANTTDAASANAAAAAPVAATGPYTPIQASPSQDIVSVLKASGEFNTFLNIADATSLTQILKTTPGITVFAPTDAAFAALPPSALDLKDQANLQKLQKLLTYHIVNTKVPPLAGTAATSVATVAGAKVRLDGSGQGVKINDATALQPQVAASNGVIYPVDKVLSPDYVPPAATPAATDTNTTTTTTTTKKSKKRHTS